VIWIEILVLLMGFNLLGIKLSLKALHSYKVSVCYQSVP